MRNIWDFTLVLVGASSDAPPAAEDGQVLLAICCLARALLAAGTHCNQEAMVKAVDSGQC